MKKTKAIISILVAFLVLIFPLTINAEDGTKIRVNDYQTNGPTQAEVADMYNFGGKVAGIVQIVGTAVSVGALIIIGIRYVISSAEEKAEYKERMIPFVIGAALLFGASNIIKIIYNLIN